jgi:hypothetical protein
VGIHDAAPHRAKKPSSAAPLLTFHFQLHMPRQQSPPSRFFLVHFAALMSAGKSYEIGDGVIHSLPLPSQTSGRGH